jgi:REP element-mobilizing transposase RayT
VFDRLRRLEIEHGLIELHASVVMPDHVHVLFRLTGSSELPVVMKRFRGGAAQVLNAALERVGPFWQRGYFDRLLRPDDSVEMILRYMWHNPEMPGRQFRCRAEIWSWFRHGISETGEYAPWLHASR